jgi:hypothetical protein
LIPHEVIRISGQSQTMILAALVRSFPQLRAWALGRGQANVYLDSSWSYEKQAKYAPDLPVSLYSMCTSMYSMYVRVCMSRLKFVAYVICRQ